MSASTKPGFRLLIQHPDGRWYLTSPLGLIQAQSYSARVIARGFAAHPVVDDRTLRRLQANYAPVEQLSIAQIGSCKCGSPQCVGVQLTTLALWRHPGAPFEALQAFVGVQPPAAAEAARGAGPAPRRRSLRERLRELLRLFVLLTTPTSRSRTGGRPV